MVGVALFQLFKQKVNSGLEIFIIFPALAGIEHIQQGIHILFFGRGFVVDVSDQSLIKQSFRFLPEVIAAFGFALGVGHDNCYKGQNVRFAMKVNEGV